MMLVNLRNKNDGPTDLPYIQRFVVPIIPDLKLANIRDDLNVVNGISTNCTAVKSGNRIILTGEKLSGYGLDMPTMNRSYFGRKARYVYCTSTLHQHEYSNCVIKVDLETKEILRWKMNEYVSPGEPFFVADPKGTKEDDGMIIFALTDRRVGHDDFLMILDARNLKEVARSKFRHIPSSLHGLFLK